MLGWSRALGGAMAGQAGRATLAPLPLGLGGEGALDR